MAPVRRRLFTIASVVSLLLWVCWTVLFGVIVRGGGHYYSWWGTALPPAFAGALKYSFPVWCLLLVLPIVWWIDRLLRRQWTRLRACAGLCQSCGYNLTGNVSGTCPECGTPISDKLKATA